MDDHTKVLVIDALEKAKVADLAIVEEAGTMLAVDDRTVHLIAWPVGVMIPEISTGELEVKEDETYTRQNILISQQHNALRQLSHLVRSLTRIVETYTQATVFATPGGDDAPST